MVNVRVDLVQQINSIYICVKFESKNKRLCRNDRISFFYVLFYFQKGGKWKRF